MYLERSAYILQQIIEQQNGYNYLDSKPQTLTSKAHRPSYGTDGDYFSKPSAEDIFEKVYAMMNEVDPSKFLIYIKNKYTIKTNRVRVGFFFLIKIVP
jgi:hypothetical protein